jgi:hypothetical protein
VGLYNYLARETTLLPPRYRFTFLFVTVFYTRCVILSDLWREQLGVGIYRWHGMAWDGMGWHEMAWHGMGWERSRMIVTHEAEVVIEVAR